MIGKAAGVCALLLAALLAGCGGGSDRSPEEEVRARSRALVSAFVREDLDAVMGFYSEQYGSDFGNNKADERDSLEGFFEAVDILNIDFVGETFTVGDEDRRVTHAFTSRISFRDRENGEVINDESAQIHVWQKEGGTWRLVFTESPDEEIETRSLKGKKTKLKPF